MPFGAVSQRRVFVSYDHRDHELAQELAHHLDEHCVRCWFFERDGVTGQNYHATINRELSASRAVIILLTENSLGSEQVFRELSQASGLGKLLLPVFAGVTAEDLALKAPRWLATIGTATTASLDQNGVARVAEKLARGLHADDDRDPGLSVPKKSVAGRPLWAAVLARVARVLAFAITGFGVGLLGGMSLMGAALMIGIACACAIHGATQLVGRILQKVTNDPGGGFMLTDDEWARELRDIAQWGAGGLLFGILFTVWEYPADAPFVQSALIGAIMAILAALLRSLFLRGAKERSAKS